jgi:hypothetical protein
LLHEELGVNMGEKFPSPDELNPKGYWEDQDLYGLDVEFWPNANMSRYYYQGLLSSMLRLRMERNTEWGVKNPWLQYSIGYYIHMLWEGWKVRPIIVRPVRSLYRREHSLLKLPHADWDDYAVRDMYNIVVMRDLVLDGNLKAYPFIKQHTILMRDDGTDEEDILKFLEEVRDNEQV